MLVSLKQVKKRIRVVQSTEKITRAMQMVSAAKLNRCENALFSGRPYYIKLDSMLKKLLTSMEATPYPLTEERPEKRSFALCIVTSDSGLCGMHNDNIIGLAEGFLDRCGAEKVKLITVGRKGFNHFKNSRARVVNSYIGLNGRYSAEISDKIASVLMDIFLTGEADEVYMAHTHFDSTLKHSPKLQKFLNIEKPKKEDSGLKYIWEPDKESVLEALIPRYIFIKTRLILLDAFSSEHSARMVAMKTATDNAVELINKLTLLRNKARQEAITTEITEISSTAEALKG